MNTVLRWLAIAFLLALTARGADEKIAAAVRAADDARVTATIAGDRTRLEAIYSADLHYAHSSGKVDDKAEHLAGLAKRNNIYERFDYQTRDVRLASPGVALMTGRVVIHSTNAKGKAQNDVNFLAVWREENGQWRLLAWQACKNLPKETAGKQQ